MRKTVDYISFKERFVALEKERKKEKVTIRIDEIVEKFFS